MLNTSQRTFDGPQAWVGSSLARDPGAWTYELTQGDVDDVRIAVAHAQGLQRDIVELSVGDFPLADFGAKLASLRAELLHGRGFCLLRGLPVASFSRVEAALTFWGIGTHLGAAVSQNGKGHVLGHVTDLGLDYADPKNRGYQTSARLPYHTDYSDLVALMCLKVAREGGASSIVSSVTVYNEMRKQRPDLAEVLMQPLFRTRWGEVGSDRPPWVEVPTFNLHDTGVVTTYVRSAVRKAQLMPEVPRLRAAQVEAMDLFDSLAENPDFHLDMNFEPGDVQILNNHWILHSRTAYVDFDEPEKKRHLLRLWLTCPDGPPFPPAMTESFQGLTENGRPNGIHVPGVPFNAPLHAQ